MVGEYIAAEVKRQERKKANTKRVIPHLDKKWFNLAIFKPEAELLAGAADEKAKMWAAERLRTKKGQQPISINNEQELDRILAKMFYGKWYL